jgi:uncharacterized protein (DUF1330 family)
MTLYALNLFDLADNDLYRQYSRRSVGAVEKHDGKVVALGKLAGAEESDPRTEPRTAMILVEWPSRDAFDAFLDDPDLRDLHPLARRRNRKLPVVDLRTVGGPEAPLPRNPWRFLIQSPVKAP